MYNEHIDVYIYIYMCMYYTTNQSDFTSQACIGRYVYIYIYAYIMRSKICIHLCIYIYTYIYVYDCMYLYIHLCMCVYIYIYCNLFEFYMYGCISQEPNKQLHICTPIHAL